MAAFFEYWRTGSGRIKVAQKNTGYTEARKLCGDKHRCLIVETSLEGNGRDEWKCVVEKLG